ncbi:MAG: hypothetical protein F6K55_13125 [Moorea sp. SIO4A3]|nr:hypothetical protein [Moorena sp. SIO4A3]
MNLLGETVLSQISSKKPSQGRKLNTISGQGKKSPDPFFGSSIASDPSFVHKVINDLAR